MADTGFINGGTATQTGSGPTAWNSPNNALTSNNTRTDTLVSTPFGNNPTTPLKITNFTHGIASGSTIVGIEARIERYKNGSENIQDHTVQMVVNGTATGDNKAFTSTNYPDSEAFSATYGGPTDLWGLNSGSPIPISSWNSTWGIILKCKNSSTSTATSAYVDVIQLKLYYSTSVDGTGNPTGVSSTTVVGTLSYQLPYPILGNDSTGQIGTLTPTFTVNQSIESVSSEAQTGLLTSQVVSNASLTNVSSQGNAGDISVFSGVFQELLGVNSGGQAGTLSTETVSSKSVTGNASTGQVNTVTSQITSFQTLTGNASAGQAGTLTTETGTSSGDTGLLSSGTIATSGGGSNPPYDNWQNPSNTATVDDSVATHLTADPDLTGTLGFAVYAVSATLQLRNFSASVPTGATIAGIEVVVTRRNLSDIEAGSASESRDYQVQLVIDGTATGDNKADTSTYYPETLTGRTYGSPTDLWGLTPTDTQINDSDFGIDFRCQNNGGVGFDSLGATEVDAIQVKIYYTTGGGGDATGNITGNSATGSAGTLATTRSSSKTLTGNAGTGSAGTLTVSVITPQSITGNEAVGAVGTLGTTLDSTQSLSGNGATGAVGSISATIEQTLSGNTATGSAGSVTASSALAQELVGNTASGSVGSLGYTLDSTQTLTGNTATGSVGTLTATLTSTQTLVGNEATGNAGTLNASTATIQNLTGNSATGSAGTVSPSLSQSIAGNVGTGQAGTLVASTAINQSITGNTATGAVGSLSSSISQPLVGNQATGSAGSLSYSLSKSVTLTGNTATGSAGTITANTDILVNLTGNSATGSAGTLGYQLSSSQTLVGNSASGQAGSLSTAVSKSQTITGNSATGSVGTLGKSLEAILTGNQASGSAGTLSAGSSASVTLTGNSAVGSVGILNATLGIIVNLLGNGATGYAGILQAIKEGYKLSCLTANINVEGQQAGLTLHLYDHYAEVCKEVFDVATVTGICNQALGLVGAMNAITSLTENSVEARLCNSYYNQTRLEVLQAIPWGFMRRQSSLALVGSYKGSDENPLGDSDLAEDGWNYTYAYPCDCLKPIMIKPSSEGGITSSFENTGDMRNAQNTIVPYIEGTRYTKTGLMRILSTNKQKAILVYQANVTDPSVFPPDFNVVLIQSLASKLVMPLTSDKKLAQMHTQIAQSMIEQAKRNHKMEYNTDQRPVVYDPMPESITGSMWGTYGN